MEEKPIFCQEETAKLPWSLLRLLSPPCRVLPVESQQPSTVVEAT